MFTVLKLNKKGLINPTDKAAFGGEFSLLDRIRLGGVGSPKMVYENGLAYFDELPAQIVGETPFLNVELLRKGLILRLNHGQRLRAVGVLLSDLTEIAVDDFNIGLQYWRYDAEQNKLIRRVLFTMTTDSGERVQCRVLHSEVQRLVRFFDRNGFDELFRHDVYHQTVSGTGNEHFDRDLDELLKLF